MVLAIIVLVRVLTLGTPEATKPDQNVLNGLGYMWNPGNSLGDILRQLKNPQLWLAAAGQIFFSLGVGFGIIITYSSYLRRQDDVVLSCLSASSANEFAEVALGGMITVPAAFVFLGAAGIVGQGTFALGFKVLPLVFSKMPFPAFFGTVWFFLLFLAAITSSLSMLQPGVAFLEEALDLNRKQSISLLGALTALGTLFVVYFSKDMKALDTIDFWVGTFLIFVMATILIIVFGWVLGIEKGWAEAHRGAEIRIPNIFKFIIKYVSPAYLFIIFAFWILFNVFGWDWKTNEFKPTGYVLDLLGSADQPPDPVARWSLLVILAFIGLTFWGVHVGGKKWTQRAVTAPGREQEEPP
jgi:SNF family Na+-dependent transporter